MDRLKLVIAYCIVCIPINWIDGSIALDFAEIPCVDVPSGPSRQSTAVQRSVGVSEGKRTRRRHQLPAGLPSEVEAPSCHSAGVIPGQTSFANVRSRAVDRTRRRDADVPNKGRAAIAVTPHSSLIVINERARDPLKRRVILQ